MQGEQWLKTTYLRVRRCAIGFLLGLLTATSNAQAQAPQAVERAYGLVEAGDTLPRQMLDLPNKGRVRLTGIPRGREALADVAVTVEKFSVVAADARMIIQEADGTHQYAVPEMAHFKGEVDGHPGSLAFVSVDKDGQIKAILHIDDDIVVSERPAPALAKAAANSRAIQHQQDFAERTFLCGADTIRDPFPHSKPVNSGASLSTAAMPGIAALTTTSYNARIAVETDFEFYQKLGSNSGAAIQYIADLFAYATTAYANEIKVNLVVGDTYLYTVDKNSDPWTAGDPPTSTSTSDALDQVGNFWITNRSGVSRTLTHFLSAKNVGGGIAWRDVLCNTNYGYGVSMGLYGNFSASNPQIIWDTVVVAHEVGHNFGSPHTHGYDNIGGIASPVDCCYSDPGNTGMCAASSGYLPGIGSLSGGSSGTRTGTIMSYCHLLSPGMSNLSFNFGTGHVYGVAADRVATQMRTRAEAASCLVPTVSYAISTAVSPVSTGSVSCSPNPVGGGGTTSCTASPSSGYVFSSWSGDCAASGTSNPCVLSNVTSAKSVTANFVDGPTVFGINQVNLSGTQGSQTSYTFPVPSGATNLVIRTFGGTGDVDLYVKAGAPPTYSVYDCRPWLPGNSESCLFASPTPGNYYVMLDGYMAYSGLSLQATYDIAGHGSVSFVSATASVAENAGTVVLPVARSSGTNGPGSVSYTSSNGSALAGSDYTTTTGVLSWAAGEGGNKNIVVPILKDSATEPAEQFTVTLSNPIGVGLGTTTMTIEITDSKGDKAKAIVPILLLLLD